MVATEERPSTAHPVHYSKSFPDSPEFLTPSTLTPEEEARVWQKIDIRLMPILALLYLFSFLDRGEYC
jgi:hypothetical protein